MQVSVDTTMENGGSMVKKQLRSVRDTLERYFEGFAGQGPEVLTGTVVSLVRESAALRQNLIRIPPSLAQGQKNPNACAAHVWVEGTKGALVQFTAKGFDGASIANLLESGPYKKRAPTSSSVTSVYEAQELSMQKSKQLASVSALELHYRSLSCSSERIEEIRNCLAAIIEEAAPGMLEYPEVLVVPVHVITPHVASCFGVPKEKYRGGIATMYSAYISSFGKRHDGPLALGVRYPDWELQTAPMLEFIGNASSIPAKAAKHRAQFGEAISLAKHNIESASPDQVVETSSPPESIVLPQSTSPLDFILELERVIAENEKRMGEISCEEDSLKTIDAEIAEMELALAEKRSQRVLCESRLGGLRSEMLTSVPPEQLKQFMSLSCKVQEVSAKLAALNLK